MAQLFPEPACIPRFGTSELGKFEKCKSHQKGRKVSGDNHTLGFLFACLFTGDVCNWRLAVSVHQKVLHCSVSNFALY